MNAESTNRVDSRLLWIKSSFSSEEGGECVEVAADSHAIHVRDSKDTANPGLTIGMDAWAMFVDHMVDELA